MIGNALRMFNVHLIFRYFSIEPPRFITRYIRRTAKGTDPFTPLLLGALTVFIPCGVTQAMMAAALGTGSAGMGAALMFAFTLGTSPVFFIVAYLTMELGARIEKFFMRFVAVVVLILGLVTLDGGLNVLGSPLSFQNLTRDLFPSAGAPASETVSAAPVVASGELYLQVENDVYFPQTLKAPAEQDIKLNLVTDKTYSCSRDFVIPALNFYQLLPDTGTVQVSIPAQAPGSKLYFTCSMGMYTGIPVSLNPWGNPDYVQDIELLDGDGSSFLVGTYSGAAVFDGSVRRTNYTSGTILQLERAGTPDSFIGASYGTLHRLSVTASGVAINPIAHEELEKWPRWKTAGYQ